MIESRSFWSLIARRASATPDALLAVDEVDRTLTFGELETRAEEVAAGLADMGIGRGSPVSWVMPTRIDTLILTASLARLGAVQNPCLPIYRERELGFVTRQTGARLLIVPGLFRGVDYLGLAEKIASSQPELAVLDVSKVLPRGEPRTLTPPPRDTGPEDAPVRWIFYTSGTTSDPKGARHTDWTLDANARGMSERLALRPDDRVALAFPITHIGGIGWLCAALMTGCALITIEIFNPDSAIRVLARNGVTQGTAGTAFHQAYLEAQRRRPGMPIFPRIRAFPGGAAPKPPKLHYDLVQEMGGAGIISGYGMTECPIIAMSDVRDAPDKLARTEGRVNPSGARIRVVLQDGRDAGAEQEGELLVRGPQLFKGYVDSSLDRAAFDDQGFFRTGDLGYLDAEGHVVITGRLKDVIIRKGENISAQEIEDLLYAHPKIVDVAVIGLPDPVSGERVCAVVQCKAGETIDLKEVVEFLLAHELMKQKLPEQVELVEEIPRNPAGKIMKREIREWFPQS